MLVEDDDLDAEALERSLRRARIANPIHRVHDGEEALVRLRASNKQDAIPTPAVILLDLNMPRMSGHEFLKQLRADADPELRRSVVFVVTTSSDDCDVKASYDRHVAGFVTKDTAGRDFSELVGLLETYWRVVELP